MFPEFTSVQNLQFCEQVRHLHFLPGDNVYKYLHGQ